MHNKSGICIVSLVHIRGDRVLLVEHDREAPGNVAEGREVLLPSGIVMAYEISAGGVVNFSAMIGRTFLDEVGLLPKKYRLLSDSYRHERCMHRFARVLAVPRGKMHPECVWHPIADILMGWVQINKYHAEIIHRITRSEHLDVRYKEIANTLPRWEDYRAGVSLPSPIRV